MVSRTVFVHFENELVNINNSAEEMQGLNGKARFEHKFRVFAFSNSLLTRQRNQLNAAAMSAAILTKLFRACDKTVSSEKIVHIFGDLLTCFDRYFLESGISTQKASNV